MVVKILAFGFVAYIRNVQNVLDFIVAVTSLVQLAVPNAKWFRALRVLRCAKPLMALDGMRQMVLAVVSRGPPSSSCHLMPAMS